MTAPGRDELELPPRRATAYLRALASGLDVLAPSQDFPPLSEGLALLRALDPELSGPLLLPARVHRRSGLPALAWCSLARAEEDLARRGAAPPPSEEELHRAEARDPGLARRLRARQRLHDYLRRHPLLPASRGGLCPRRAGERVGVELRFDHLAPDGSWLRLRAELEGPAGWEQLGPVRWRPGQLPEPDPGLLHLLARHVESPLPVLHEQLHRFTGVDVPLLSRGRVGPFWVPGLSSPAGLPAPLARGLLLHLQLERLGRGVAQRDLDPLADEPLDPPPGLGSFRERRLAASPPVLEAVREWVLARGGPVLLLPLEPRRLAEWED